MAVYCGAGASSGIGAEAARVFALAGATVWFAGRDDAKTAGVRDAVAAEVGPSAAGRLHTLHLDLSSLASVRAAAAEFLATGQPLHILLNNAGGSPCAPSLCRERAVSSVFHWRSLCVIHRHVRCSSARALCTSM
jgi:NAD(P)-dependent dehydrogenase (short-subunit alcohol dehydrogenase family)